jgi:hypothetical protein
MPTRVRLHTKKSTKEFMVAIIETNMSTITLTLRFDTKSSS